MNLRMRLDGAGDGNPVCVPTFVNGLGEYQVLEDGPGLRIVLDFSQ